MVKIESAEFKISNGKPKLTYLIFPLVFADNLQVIKDVENAPNSDEDGPEEDEDPWCVICAMDAAST